MGLDVNRREFLKIAAGAGMLIGVIVPALVGGAFLAAPADLREDDRLADFALERDDLRLELSPVGQDVVERRIRPRGQLVIAGHPDVIEQRPERDLGRLVVVPVRRVAQLAAVLLAYLPDDLPPLVGVLLGLDQFRALF